MRRALHLLGLSGALLTGFSSTHAVAAEPADASPDIELTEPQQPAPAVADAAPAPVAETAEPAAKAKLGDITVSGYLRGGFGASNQKGRMSCFQLAIPGGLVSKYRLGNECEVWSETHFKLVAYAGEDGTVATVHVMPTVYIPTTYIGYSPTATTSSPAQYTTSTGATVSFPNLYVDLAGIPWLQGGTAWMGTRYYKRESIYISDFFYWNPSGVGAGIEDIHLGKDLRLSYGAFAVDGDPGQTSSNTSPPPRDQNAFGVRSDLQLRGIHPWESGEVQLGFQYIADLSNAYDVNGVRTTHSGWGATIQFVQKLLGGDNKL